MTLLDSLLDAIVRLEGDALVMHVGEKPYVVAPEGPIEISTQALNVQAMESMLSELLPESLQGSLEQLGAVDHQPSATPAMMGDEFTVVAARSADDLWIDIQRHRRKQPEPAPAPEPVTPHSAPSTPAPELEIESEPEAEPERLAPRRDAGSASSSSGAEVIPMNRPMRIEPPHAPPRHAPVAPDRARLLSAAAAARATAVYLTSGAPPFARIDDDVRRLEGWEPLTAQEIDSLLLESAPQAMRDALRQGEACEWLIDSGEAGRVRCHCFRDYRGPGAMLEMLSARPQTAEQLALPSDARALASESDGLVIIAAPRGHGRTTLAAAYVDAINQQRHCYAISLERQVRIVHEPRAALVSQREVQGTGAQATGAARAALAERPDVLVMDDLQSVEMMQVMFDAVAGGALGFVTVEAPTTLIALQRIIDLFPEARRNWVRSVLVDRLRGALAQSLLRHIHGGRVAAREILLPTAAVRTAISTGRAGDLPAALAEGRKYGLVSLTDSLIDLVRSEAVDIREAYRRADDRDGLLRALKRERVDLSLVERLA